MTGFVPQPAPTWPAQERGGGGGGGGCFGGLQLKPLAYNTSKCVRAARTRSVSGQQREPRVLFDEPPLRYECSITCFVSPMFRWEMCLSVLFSIHFAVDAVEAPIAPAHLQPAELSSRQQITNNGAVPKQQLQRRKLRADPGIPTKSSTTNSSSTSPATF